MVTERFRNADLKPVGERFRSKGRMLPDGVAYHASWMEPSGARCFQIMEAASEEFIGEWTNRWSDIVDFEIVAVLTSEAFWGRTT